MSTNKELEGVIDAIGKWRFFLGIKEKASKEEIIINTQFIREHFGELNVVDLHEAMQLSIAGKLDVDNNHYGNFGPLYISRILNAYKDYRNEVISYCKKQIKLAEKKKLPPPRDKKKDLEDMVNFFVSAHETAKKNFFDDFGDVWYNFAKRNKMLDINEDLISRAKRYGSERAMDDARDGILMKMQLNQRMTKDQQEYKQRKYARSYVVNDWLKSIKDPKIFSKSFTIEMFE